MKDCGVTILFYFSCRDPKDMKRYYTHQIKKPLKLKSCLDIAGSDLGFGFLLQLTLNIL